MRDDAKNLLERLDHEVSKLQALGVSLHDGQGNIAPKTFYTHHEKALQNKSSLENSR